jgi:hypothetical protein
MKKKIRRINLFGGAACGKSITATNVRAQLGFKGYDIELVDEVIKDWTYIPRIPKDCDSFFLQASQIQKEDIRLRAGVDLIVSDSPLYLQYFYAWYHKVPLQYPMALASFEFDEIYKPLQIFIEREDKFYNEVGRYEKLDEAKKIDRLIKEQMTADNIEFKCLSCLDQDGIVDYIISEVEKSNA